MTDTKPSVALREATMDVHDEAENSTYMSDLLQGKLTREAYYDLLGQLIFVYRALEECGETVSGTPVGGALVDERLLRVGAIAADLTYLRGDHVWREEIEPLPATREYVDRLDAIADARDGVAFAAHHYVRYLGDLAGGQVIGRMMKTHYELGEGGVDTYRFEDIPKVKPYRDDYRNTLDSLPELQENLDHLVEEARAAFRLNIALFNALGELHPST
ncbi:biliverdin-producing heme oxygenase [Corynebacterium sp. 335C]